MSAPRELVFLDDHYYVHATSSRVDSQKRVLKHDEIFGVFDRFGDIHPFGHGEHGIYHRDTRFLSRFELSIAGRRPLLLNSNVSDENSIFSVDLTNADLEENGRVTVPRGEVHIFRGKLLWEAACCELIRVTNFTHRPVELPLSIVFAADYADIFEVRGLHREQKGRHDGSRLLDHGAMLSYTGLDGVARRTLITCTPAPDQVRSDSLDFRLKLEPRGSSTLRIEIACQIGERLPRRVCTFEEAERRTRAAVDAASAGQCGIHTANAQFNEWIRRSMADLTMLATRTERGLYPYAGVPWYSTIFGRDGLFTALQTLWLQPELARGVLDVLAGMQAEGVDASRDAEPGKIVHEVRKGEMAALGEVPFGCYYGTVDATPLFLMLAGRYFEHTGDLEYARSLWPHVERALAWIDEYGDKDGDGFVEYQRQNERGLANQGWKDSLDSVSHGDGTLATGAIALAEVQGYVYEGKLAAAGIARALGDEPRAVRLETQAARLFEQFNERFWCEPLETYALALDGEKRPCAVRASNAGHVLFTGLATPERARRTAATLLAEHSFSGWGVRTLSRLEARYNPMSYHNGSVWPHDTAVIAAGFARYGMRAEALQLLHGLFDAARVLEERRLPELFCGFRRRVGQGPTLYPVACLPQAWASGAVFMLLQACLGISVGRDRPQIRFTKPMLPDYLQWVRLENLRVGDGSVDLMLQRHTRDVGVNVLRSEGQVGVAVHLEP